jgi:hypothetical protein
MTEVKNENTWQRFGKKPVITALVASTVYLLWMVFFVGFRNDHAFILAASLTAYFASPKSRQIFSDFSIFLLYWIIYDSMRVYPNYKFNPVHIQQPYDFEKSLFGIPFGDSIITPNEYFAIFHSKFLDVLSAVFYLNWVPIPLFFAFYFYFKGYKQLFRDFSFVFVFVNFIGFVFYYIYPAAPPWYVALYGFDLLPDTMGNSAEFHRFDTLVGIPVFASIYEKNANIFAAIPSLHSAYPVVLFYYGQKLKRPGLNVLFVIFMLGIWFSAVYSGHHYIIDVILGAFCAVIGIAIYEVTRGIIKNNS